MLIAPCWAIVGSSRCPIYRRSPVEVDEAVAFSSAPVAALYPEEAAEVAPAVLDVRANDEKLAFVSDESSPIAAMSGFYG